MCVWLCCYWIPLPWFFHWILDPLTWHVSPLPFTPFMPHKRWMVLSFDIPSRELCEGEFLLAISSHKWPTTWNQTSYAPGYKSLVVAPNPRSFFLGLQVSSPFHLQNLLFLFPPLTSFPTPLYSWAPCLLPQYSFLRLSGTALSCRVVGAIYFILASQRRNYEKDLFTKCLLKELSFKKQLFSWRISQPALENAFLLYTFLPSYNTVEHPAPQPTTTFLY